MNNTSKDKILILTSFFYYDKSGNYGSFTYELCLQLSYYFNIFVLTPNYNDFPKKEIINNIKIFRFNFFPRIFNFYPFKYGIFPSIRKNKFNYLLLPFFFIAQLFAIIRTLKKEKIKIINAHWIIPQGLIVVIYKKIFNKKVKILATIHGGDIFGIKGRFATYLKKYTLQNIDELTVVSNAIKSKVKELGYRKHIYVYPMGVDTKLFNSDKKDKQLRKTLQIGENFLLFVGSLSENKGIKYLIQAIPYVLERFPSTTLIIIGTGILEKEFKKLSNSLNLNNNVKFIGAIEHESLPSYYATADIFIGPSIVAKDGVSEGF